MQSASFSLSAFPTPRDVLHDVYGYDTFREPQEAIIHEVTEGRSAFVLMPTGGGKSLCYQIPALCMAGVGIVISPLIALMDDQVAALEQLGIAAAAMHSGLLPEAASQCRARLLAGELKLLYVSPERLVLADFMALLRRIPLALFAIDEAHCVSQWGHDFRPEYRGLAVLAEAFPHVPRLALTATADALTRQDIRQRLRLEEAKEFISGFDRPNIRYEIVERHNTRQQLLTFIRAQPAGASGIVYCISRSKTDETAEFLKAEGFDALPYHAGMTPEQRSTNQRRFLREDGVVMVATVAFGMGINKPDVRFVAHVNIPRNIEAYYQETGRAGRDGQAAVAWMAYGMNDVVLQQNWIRDSDAPEEQKRIQQSKLSALLALCEEAECRRVRLLHYFGNEPSQHCGNCDNCLNPPRQWDAGEAALKALSCVYRTGQRFGVGYVTDVLRGVISPRLVENGHDKISTFAIGQDVPARLWQRVFRQLMARGLLEVSNEFGAVGMTHSARDFLRDKPAFPLRIENEKAAKSKAVRPTRRAGSEIEENPLYLALKQKRQELAQRQNVPAYVVFHNSVLEALVREKPDSIDEMAAIEGIGLTKLERYGKDFLSVLQEHAA